MIGPLSSSGLSFRIVFHSPDYHARLCAVRAGMGLTATPVNFTPPELIEANEYYLPKLPPIQAALCTRAGIERRQVAGLLQQLSQYFSEENFAAATK